MTENKSRAPQDAEDLSVLSRRGALSSAQRQAFSEVLASNEALAIAHQVGLDFDQALAVRPGDDALIAKALARVVSRERVTGTTRARLRPRVLLLAATLALAGSAVAWWQRVRAPGAAPPPATPTSQSSSDVRAPKDKTADVAATSVPTAQDESSPARAGAAAVANGPASAPSARGDSRRAGDSAELLFREANAARRAGDSSIARGLYLRLQRDFPASDEAHLAHVSLGNLLLNMGRPAEAERQFASYVAGRSALAQEALVGRAQSLAALGRSGEERRVWEALLLEYPNSVHAARARLRLAKLAVSAAAPE